ncbi:TonB-dependent siderophore receptor [uncultured Acidaminococcus sp.]|uniref:TonB-dependent receptor plug domain-containing protein n=1 Tax=uncultured Acidaminococcus sp. TaxID=352152 RepID=UPI0026666B7D|nr:TonB-dependent receptor [uncultured Acidaminococcus sp.]
MKEVWNQKLAAAVLTAVLAGSTSVVWAAEQDQAEKPAQEIVITANRLKNQKVDTPADVTVITSQQISDRGYRTVTDALEDVPGARVMQSGVGAYESHITLNGDQRVLVLVDGRRFNNSMGSMVKATFDAHTLPPVDMIEKIEVVKGGASTLYGADAVGGVINIITKTPEETTGKIRVGYGSWGNQDLGLSVGGKVDKNGIQVAASRNKASYFKYKDKNGDTRKWPGQSNYTQDNISLKLTHDFTESDGLTLNYDYSIMEGNNPYSVNSYAPSPVDKKTNNVGLRYDWNRDAKNSGYLQTYRNYTNYFNLGGMDETDWGIESQQNFVLSDTNTLVGGLEYRDAKAHNETSYQGKKGYNNKAVFLQDQWQFAPTWQLNTGVRYDKHSRSGNRTTGSAAINKKFSKDSHAYFSWNQVFRTPTIDDLYYRNIGSSEFGGYTYEYGYFGKDDLKPETGNVYTLGYNFKVDKKTDASVTAFYSNLHNALNWRYDYPYYYAENINREKKRGLSLTVTHKLNKLWDVDASYTYMRVTGKSTGYVRDNNYAPNYYQAGVRYHDTKWNLDLRARAANGLSKASYGEQRYLTMDFIARYKFDQNWTGFANFYNLNNAAYAEQGGVVNGQDSNPMPGRRIIVGAEYSF